MSSNLDDHFAHVFIISCSITPPFPANQQRYPPLRCHRSPSEIISLSLSLSHRYAHPVYCWFSTSPSIVFNRRLIFQYDSVAFDRQTRFVRRKRTFSKVQNSVTDCDAQKIKYLRAGKSTLVRYVLEKWSRRVNIACCSPLYISPSRTRCAQCARVEKSKYILLWDLTTENRFFASTVTGF